MDERQLVSQILSGEEKAKEAFYRLYRDRLYATAVHFLGYQDPEAEDVMQQAFLIAYSKIGEFRFESSLYTWINHICVFQCFERIRQRKKVCVSQDEEFEVLTGPMALRREEAGALDRLTEGRLVWMRAAIAGMKKRCREVVELRDIQGLDFAVAARKLKIPLGTFLSRLARCRESLKRMAKSPSNTGL